MATQAQIYEALLKKHGRAIASAFRRVVRSNTMRVDLTALSEAIRTRNLTAVADLIGMTPERLFPLSEAVRNAFIDAGVSVEALAPLAASFSFDGSHPIAQRWITEHSSRLVQGIADEALAMARETIGEGIASGRSSDVVARDLVGRGKARVGGRIGLTSQQAQAVSASRVDLEKLDNRYFSRTLRDRRYDKTVRDAIDSGKPLTQSQIDKITGRYSERLEGYRARVIAQNEARQAITSGQHISYNQLLDAPDVEAITVRWQYNFGSQETHREAHMALGTAPARPINEPFVMPDGTEMMHPNDPAGSPKWTIGCQCTAIRRVVMKA